MVTKYKFMSKHYTLLKRTAEFGHYFPIKQSISYGFNES